MQIGISSWACPWAIGVAGYPFPEKPMGAMGLLQAAAAEGAQVLQVADNLPLHALSRGELRELAGEAGRSGIALEAGTRGLAPENLFQYLDIAGELNAKLVRTLPHDGPDRPDFEEALRRLHAVKPAFEAAGVVLAIENHDFYPSLWLRRLVEAAGSPYIGVCLDAVNNLGLGEGFREVLSALGPHTVNFHCKDYTIARKPTMLCFDVTGAAAGEGMLDLQLARSALREDISWVLESWLPWQGDIHATLFVEREWLARGIASLRRIAQQEAAQQRGNREDATVR